MPNRFIENYKKNKKFLEKNHIYDEKDEHNKCQWSNVQVV